MWHKIFKVLITRYVLLISILISLGINNSTLVFWICPIIHKQLLAVLQGHVKFVYKSYLRFSTDFGFCRNPRKIFSQLCLSHAWGWGIRISNYYMLTAPALLFRTGMGRVRLS